MNTFLLKISSPDGDLFCGDAVQLNVRGTEGDLAVMAGHIPFITAIKPCDCWIDLPDGSSRDGHTDGGLLTVSAEKTVFLSGSFSWK
ncbi:MAG: hypothetical protein IJC17_03460 [Clostridia bacterium]|nr:hypothetical protein [Clostridia bacterium]